MTDTRKNNDWERIDVDENATTDDTRLRVDQGDHGTFELRRERYGLVEFETSVEADDGQGFERYDWHTDERFVLQSAAEAKQVASMLADAEAFDPTILFFRQFDPDDLDLSDVRERIERAMAALGDGETPDHDAEAELQRAYDALGGEREELDVDGDSE